MSALTCYRPEDVLAAVQVISLDLSQRRIDPEEASTQLEPLVFRDSVGTWWAVGVRTLRWYRHTGAHWEAALAAPHRLEGLVGLIAPSLPETDEPPASEAGQTLKPVQAMLSWMNDLRERYEQGMLTSDAVQGFLTSQYLVDRNGYIWALGFQTRGWFFFHHSWQPSADPPDPDNLVSPEKTIRTCPDCQKSFPQEAAFCAQCGGRLQPALDVSPGAAENLGEFLEKGSGTLPEPVVHAWEPPTGLPEDTVEPAEESAPAEACACGCRFPPDARFCPKCGTKRPVPRPENCSGCGQKLLPEARFCAYCGQPASP